MMINVNFDMFRYFLGTCFEFAEILAITLLTGWYLERHRIATGTGAISHPTA